MWERQMRYSKTTILAFVFMCAFITPANAQKFEVHPYAGGFFSGKVAGLLDVKNQPLYGIKGGMFANKNFEIEGNIGYIHMLIYGKVWRLITCQSSTVPMVWEPSRQASAPIVRIFSAMRSQPATRFFR